VPPGKATAGEQGPIWRSLVVLPLIAAPAVLRSNTELFHCMPMPCLQTGGD
jgi:hypothetical protein